MTGTWNQMRTTSKVDVKTLRSIDFAIRRAKTYVKTSVLEKIDRMSIRRVFR